MNFCAILAAGSGTRMVGASLPKQFLKIGDLPILIVTVKNILETYLFDKVVVSVQPDWRQYTESLFQRYGIAMNSIFMVDGGKTRLETIGNVLDFLDESENISDDDKIVIHDGVRPFITKKILNDSLNALNKFDAVVASVAVRDTMLWSEDGQVVDLMPDRSKIYHGQSPDSFVVKTLINAFRSLSSKDKDEITGTAQICFVNKIRVGMIPGDVLNIKITTKEDLILANKIFTLRNSVDEGMRS